MNELDAKLAQRILNTLSCSFGLSLGEVQVHGASGHVWRLTAENPQTGERWTATGPEYYPTVCALAELCGMELEG
ncbi:MAG: hypothetical protein JSS51_12620 [Planctomycetes bacterium]|nr:hypothetical protein [Planctomycetota bacterium]